MVGCGGEGSGGCRLWRCASMTEFELCRKDETAAPCCRGGKCARNLCEDVSEIGSVFLENQKILSRPSKQVMTAE